MLLYRVEVTPLVLLPVQTTVHSLPGGYSSPSTVGVVRSSIVGERARNSGRNKLMSSQSDEEGRPEQKIYFAQLGQLISSIANQLRPPVLTTTTITRTNTRTTTTTTFSTASFFVMSCTPSPFPFSVCPAKRFHAD
ncbi:Uncharacterized protein APZ42_017362 [Daphnia magna]|uniref:Uncharacterized protein n=1 Tax=Daphnia magna TaxID=35525 RepID=A0A164ZTW0_9CRUS|nr:Uncharacterized protein APZ42_017362 [Daphnia magna]